MTRLILVQPLVSSSQRCACKVQSFASCQITQCTSGALWVYWTWQVKVGRVGRCQVSPMRSVVQVLCLINKIWNIEIELEQSRFENDRTISFIPPDGEFELMSYRLNTHVKVEQDWKTLLPNTSSPASDLDRVGDWAARPQQDWDHGQGEVPIQEKVGSILEDNVHLLFGSNVTNSPSGRLPTMLRLWSPCLKMLIHLSSRPQLVIFVWKGIKATLLQIISVYFAFQAIASMLLSRMQSSGRSSPSLEEKWAIIPYYKFIETE